MAKAITDATFEQETKDGFGLGRLLGNLVWSMSYAKVQSWINYLKNFQKMS